MLHIILRFVSLLSFIIKKRVSDRKPFYPLKGRSVGGSARRVSVRLSAPLSSALHKNRFTPGDRAGIHTSCRSESSNSKLGQFRQHYNLLQDYLHCKSMSPPLTFVLWFCRTCEFEQENNSDAQICNERDRKVAWPSGLRRWFKAPVSSEAWVRIPPLPTNSFSIIWSFFFIHHS